MCVSDWRLGRLMSVRYQPWNLVSGEGVTLPANRQRVGLIITTSVVLGTTAGFSLTSGGVLIMSIYGLAAYKEFSLAEHGIFVQQDFVVGQQNAASIGAYIETTMPERYLSAALNEFNSKYGIQ